jgi:hypothetical protein
MKKLNIDELREKTQFDSLLTKTDYYKVLESLLYKLKSYCQLTRTRIKAKLTVNNRKNC